MQLHVVTHHALHVCPAAGSVSLLDNLPLEDAQVLKLLKQRGALVLAKTACGEFAFFPAFCLSRQALKLWGLSWCQAVWGRALHAVTVSMQSATTIDIYIGFPAACRASCGIHITWATPLREAAAAPRRRQRPASEWRRWGLTQATA